MALLAMVVYATEENGRMQWAKEAILSVRLTVDFNKHRFIISDNGSCEEMQLFYEGLPSLTVIKNGENLGTSRAINKIIKLRKPGEHVCKIDDDVLVHQSGWLDDLEECIKRDPLIGIAALKRYDLKECPWEINPMYKSELKMLPHELGQCWLLGEVSPTVIGTCTLFNSAFLDKAGYSQQFSSYGLEDFISSFKSKLLGFYNFFLSGIKISHIDDGSNKEYFDWKGKVAGEGWAQTQQLINDMKLGKVPIYYGGEDEN